MHEASRAGGANSHGAQCCLRPVQFAPPVRLPHTWELSDVSKKLAIAIVVFGLAAGVAHAQTKPTLTVYTYSQPKYGTWQNRQGALRGMRLRAQLGHGGGCPVIAACASKAETTKANVVLGLDINLAAESEGARNRTAGSIQKICHSRSRGRTTSCYPSTGAISRLCMMPADSANPPAESEGTGREPQQPRDTVLQESAHQRTRSRFHALDAQSLRRSRASATRETARRHVHQRVV